MTVKFQFRSLIPVSSCTCTFLNDNFIFRYKSRRDHSLAHRVLTPNQQSLRADCTIYESDRRNFISIERHRSNCPSRLLVQVSLAFSLVLLLCGAQPPIRYENDSRFTWNRNSVYYGGGLKKKILIEMYSLNIINILKNDLYLW